DHRKSAFKERLSLNLRAAANPNTRQAPTNACAQKRLVYAHIGVPRDMARAPNAAALVSLPSRRARKNKHTLASALGKATALAGALHDSATSPRGDSGSTTTARMAGSATRATGTARNPNPGALSE